MKKILTGLALIIGIMGAFMGVSQVAVMDVMAESSTSTIQDGVEAIRPDNLPSDLVATFKQVTNNILYVVGIVAIVMLVVGGIKYIVSGGDSKKVTDAKNTVLYAIIGLVIAILSWAIVNFVVSALPSGESENSGATTAVLVEK